MRDKDGQEISVQAIKDRLKAKRQRQKVNRQAKIKAHTEAQTPLGFVGALGRGELGKGPAACTPNARLSRTSRTCMVTEVTVEGRSRRRRPQRRWRP